MKDKRFVYYARTYRHLKIDKKKCFLYFALLVLPCLIGYLFWIQEITESMTKSGIYILEQIYPDRIFFSVSEELSVFGKVEYIQMPTVLPGFPMIFVNLVIMILSAAVLSTGKRKGKPLSIYVLFSVVIHLINCIYFSFAAEYFPYSASDYSELYIKQQIGIWLTFIVLSGLVTGFLGNRAYFAKTMAFLGIICYSFVFGIVRYVVFLVILQEFSILYMAVLFFVLGPMFDFVYLVAIYSVLINKMVKVYDSGDGREEWEWS